MIATKRLIRSGIISLAVAVAIYVLWVVRGGLYPFIIALLLAYIINPAVCFFEHKGIKRLWAIIVVYFILFSMLIIIGSRIIPMLVRELENFGKELPVITYKGEEMLQLIKWQYINSSLPHSLRIAVDNVLASLQGKIQDFIAAAVEAIVSLVTHSIGLAISPVLAFYLLHDWYLIKEDLLFVIPSRWRHEVIIVMKDIDKVLNGVIRGQVTVAIIVGVLISAGLHLLNVKYALIIGIIAGMLDIIPYFGAIIGATPAVILALLQSSFLAIKVIVLFLIVHQLEGTIIGPKILGEKVGLHPLAVIFFLFVGGEFGGLLGMLLGVPIAAIGKVLLKHLVRVLV